MRSGVRIGFALVCCAPLAAQPAVTDGGVVNAASYLPGVLANGGIAQGAMFVVFGSGLGPPQLAQTPRLPLGTELAGTEVRVVAAGSEYPAYLLYTSAGQISGLLPSAVPEGPAQLYVRYAGRDGNRVAIRVRGSAFGIFTQNQAGSGPAIVQNFINATTAPRMNGLLQTIWPGQVAILWGTGLGAITASDADRPPAGDLPVEVEVLVAERPARVLYRGRSPEFPGLDQINFEVPEGVFGCYVPVAVRAGGVMSNYASLSISSAGSVCGDAVSFRGALLAAGANRGEIRAGVVELQHTEYALPGAAPLFWNEQASARFWGIDHLQINRLAHYPEMAVLPGACTVTMNRWNGDDPDDVLDLYPNLSIPVRRMSAGAFLRITGPKGEKQVYGGESGYGLRIGGMDDPGGRADPAFLDPGSYTIASAFPPPGGDFTATLAIPQALVRWTNRDRITSVDRSAALRFEWTGGLNGREYVIVGGSAADQATRTRVTFLCGAQPSAGSFTVPSRIVELLPANTVPLAGGFRQGLLFLATSPVNTMANVTGNGFDMLAVRYLFTTYSLVEIR